MDIDALKARATAAIDREAAALIDLSLRIHAHPEVAFEETQAAAWLCDFLRERRFDVTPGIAGLPTAFRASAGSGSPVVAVLAEYDALPGIGHGCGHNIIATTAAGAGTGVRAVIDELSGSVQVIGTPAEEVYNGKAIMIREGAFDGIDAAIMTHPGTRDAVFALALACAELQVEYFGREAHAAAQPERGVNALEAMIIAYNAINSLRQHMRRTARVHGVITDGGEAPNIVPGHSAASFLVRAEDDAYLEKLKERVADCFEAGAKATGARLELRWNVNQYAAMNTNSVIAAAHRRNLAAVGRALPETETPLPMGSTDMGNVSKIVPAIHPTILIAPPEVNGHSPEFAEYAASDTGKKAVIDGAKALAMTAIDILADADLRTAMREEFERTTAQSGVAVTALDAYSDDELAALYDLVYQSYDDDLRLYEEFARRGESPSLELGVGTGRVALHLARSGFHVVGLDSSLRMLARLEAAMDAATAQRLRLVEGDMRDFDLGEKFDLVYCALDTFEHLLTNADQLATLRCVARHLAPGGVFVTEMRSLTAVDWSDEPSPLRLEWVWPDAETGEQVAKMSSVRSSRSRQLTMFTLVFDRTGSDGMVRRRTFDVTLRATGRYEMEMLLERAGLRLAAIYGGTDLSPFTDDSDTMVIVAELEGT